MSACKNYSHPEIDLTTNQKQPKSEVPSKKIYEYPMLEEIEANVRKLQEEVKVLQAQMELQNLRIPSTDPCQGTLNVDELKEESVSLTSKDNKSVCATLEVEENIQGILVEDKDKSGSKEITGHDNNCSQDGETGTDLNIATWTRLIKRNSDPEQEQVPEPNTAETETILVRVVKEYGSLGLSIDTTTENERSSVRISRITQGRPADRTGRLFAGDRILSVNGQDLRNVTHDKAVHALQMAGDVVELLVEFVKEDEIPYRRKPRMLGELGFERSTLKNSVAETREVVKEDSLSTSTGNNCIFVVRESLGTYGLIGTACKPWKILNKVEKRIRFTILSSDGRYLAIGKESSMDILKAMNDSVTYATLPHRVLSAQFSKQSKFLVTWEEPGHGIENFKIWSLDDEYKANQTFNCGNKVPRLVYCQALSKLPQLDFSWNDEFVSRTCNDDDDVYNHCVLFYATPDFHNAIAGRNRNQASFTDISWSPGANQSTYLAICNIGKVRIGMYKYPEINHKILESFLIRPDRFSVKWNQYGTAVLVATLVDAIPVDPYTSKSGAVECYDIEGKFHKHFIPAENYSSIDLVAFEWRPNSSEYCLIFGKMPHTQAAMLNLTGEIILNIGVGHRNEIHFNLQGNIVLVCGVGKDYPGEIDIWELEKYKRCIARVRPESVTQVEWLNDGIHFITATTSPTMELNNGFKIWDFTGNVVGEWKAEKQLYSITSIPIPRDQLAFPHKMLDDHIKAMSKMKMSPHAKAVNAPSAQP